MSVLSALKRWRIVALIVVLVVIAGGAFVVYRNATGTESAELEEDQQLVAVRRGELVNEISVSGSVSFPERENMTFGSKGVVAEVLVKEGERVSAGDVIARLDAETIARLEREVTEANAALRDAQEELDDLVSPPDLAIAEARHKVAMAQDALEDATYVFNRIAGPSNLQVAEAEARVASAALSLNQAEEALEEEVDPTSALAVAQAQMQVVDAEIALADLENAPSELESAQAEAKVTDAQVALQSAIDARDDYIEGPPEVDLSDAEYAVATAESNLSNSQADLQVALRDWDVAIEQAFDALDSAGDTYAETFTTWLGITEDPASIDPDYQAALSAFGVDLNALFSESDRYSGLSYNAPELPPDDPSTAWNETRVYVWLHFTTSKLVPTCDEGDRPQFGVCIEDEFRASADSYQAAIDNKDEVEARASNALVAAQTKVDSAQTALRDADETLADLREPADRLIVDQLDANVRLAEEVLTDAIQEMADLIQLSNPLAIADRQRQIEVAIATVDDAREKLDNLTAPKVPAEIDHLEEQVNLAKANLEEARADLAELESGVEHPEYSVAIRTVDVARETLAGELEKLDELTGEPDPIDLALLRSKLDAAQTLLEESQERLTDAIGLMAPSDGFVSRVNAEEGEDIEANDVVALLVDTSVVEIDGTVDEIDVLSIETDVAAEVNMDALPDQTILGKVSFVGAEATDRQGQGVVSYPVRIKIEMPPDLKAPEGLSAVATIILSRETDVLLIPANAIRGSFDNPMVHLMVNDEPVETPVSLGNSDDFWTIVTDGLNEGDMVAAVAPEGQDVKFFTDGEDNGN